MAVLPMLALVLSSYVIIVPVSAADKPSNPVSRVVDLMKGLSLKLEMQGKAEFGLYEDFVCWGKSVISQKTASNEAAESEIDELKGYISDLDNGKVELTDERTKLNGEIKDLSETLETEAGLREQEHADFLKAEKDMEMAIEALNKSIEVLGEAMRPKTAPAPAPAPAPASMLSLNAQVTSSIRNSGGMAALAEDAAKLQRAVKLGDRFLTKADAHFLRRLLIGQVPKVDWKKLNRKATFKMSYKARSGKIISTLSEMLATFETNLADAKEKEKADKEAYEKLSAAKSGELSAAQTALEEMAEENGARGLSKEESLAQVELLTTQVKNDKKYIADTQDALDEKKVEYKARKKVRDGELEAISKAISILYSDESRDLFQKSFESQGYLQLASREKPSQGLVFLQRVKSHTSSAARRWQKAAAVLRNAEQATEDARLLKLARLAPNESAQIKPVVEAIDSMIEDLNEEEAKDLEQKEQCEKGRMDDTRDAIVMAREIDDFTDAITQLSEEITGLEEKIAAASKTKEETQEQLNEATAIRAKENAEFKSNEDDDVKAAELVAQAKEVIASFYTSNNLTLDLLQQPAEPVAPGDAPPPPPKTWEGGYLGAKMGSGNIITSLEIIHEDIETDIAKAKSDEAEALAKFTKFKKESEEQIDDLDKQITADTGLMGDKKTDKADTINQRALKKGDLVAALKNIAAVAAAGCDYIAINYALRVKNRQIEMDSLTKAKAILEGGEFTAPDPNREIKPGDAAAAFVQRTAHSLRGGAHHEFFGVA